MELEIGFSGNGVVGGLPNKDLDCCERGKSVDQTINEYIFLVMMK